MILTARNGRRPGWPRWPGPRYRSINNLSEIRFFYGGRLQLDHLGHRVPNGEGGGHAQPIPRGNFTLHGFGLRQTTLVRPCARAHGFGRIRQGSVLATRQTRS